MTTMMSVLCECARISIRPRRTDPPRVAAFPPPSRGLRPPRKLIRDLPARAPLTRPLPPSPKRSPLHDAAEVGDVELILKLLSKESNDGDFNPVRLAPPSLSSDSAIVELGRPVEADEKKLRKNPHL